MAYPVASGADRHGSERGCICRAVDTTVGDEQFLATIQRATIQQDTRTTRGGAYPSRMHTIAGTTASVYLSGALSPALKAWNG
jgi:hypothetical protein